MVHVQPMPAPRLGPVSSPFSLTYTLDCRVSRSSASSSVTALALAGQADALTYTYHFTIDVGLLRAAALLLFLLVVLPRVAWRAGVAVAAVLGWGVAHFVWRDVAAPTVTLLLAGRAEAQSAARRWVAAAPAWRSRVHEHAAAGRRTVVGVFKAAVAASIVLFLALTAVWALRWVAVMPFGRGENMRSPGPTRTDYDEMVRTAKVRWEQPITDWNWADGYVTRPCRFPRCVLPEDD